MERYSVHDEYMTPSEHGNVVLYDDTQRALDAEREKVKELEAMYRQQLDERDKRIGELAESAKIWMERCNTIQAQADHTRIERNRLWGELADRQAQLRQVEGDRQTIRQLVEVHTKQLTELTIIPIGCSRGQELRWTQSIKDLRAVLAAQDAGKEDVSHE